MKSLTMLSVLLVGATLASAQPELRVISSTAFVADVVTHVGGDMIDNSPLIPPGADPHAFEPTPQDAARLADADAVFINGAGLETDYLPTLLKKSKTEARIVDLSEGLTLRTLPNGETDPHLWFNPQNMIHWAGRVFATLSEMDPANSNAFARRTEEYRGDLAHLDKWAAGIMREVPAVRRKLVTDHLAFGYFADRYRFEVVGAVLPALSTGAEPSARDLAQLQDAIRDQDVKAIFVGSAVDSALGQRVADDTGIRLVSLDACTLNPGSDYFQFIINLVEKISASLK